MTTDDDARPLNVTLSTSPAGTLAVSVRHDDGRTVFACTSSFMHMIDMTPARWREFIAAVQAKLDEVVACGRGRSEEVPPCGVCPACRRAAVEPVRVGQDSACQSEH